MKSLMCMASLKNNLDFVKWWTVAWIQDWMGRIKEWRAHSKMIWAAWQCVLSEWDIYNILVAILQYSDLGRDVTHRDICYQSLFQWLQFWWLLNNECYFGGCYISGYNLVAAFQYFVYRHQNVSHFVWILFFLNCCSRIQCTLWPAWHLQLTLTMTRREQCKNLNTIY